MWFVRAHLCSQTLDQDWIAKLKAFGLVDGDQLTVAAQRRIFTGLPLGARLEMLPASKARGLTKSLHVAPKEPLLSDLCP